ncbi:peritrophin-1-like [Episyrphus balteatus]|uniref:peritrophin-1-like n=1 Tax=Episyrphus balteatus TaxID=286459 RepID=UPI0024856FC1|nr:peritrophin-1-like [Episyrphus balteatus]
MKLLGSLVYFFAFLGATIVSGMIICPDVQNKASYVVQYPSPISCSEFFKCDNGIPIVQTCPNGLHYNPRKRVCDYIASARCNLSDYQ